MKKQQFKRLLSLVIAIVMCLGLAIPAGATDITDGTNVIVEKVDNSRVSANLRNPGEAVDPVEEAPIYADTDNVRVSIVLEAMPAIRLANLQGVSTTEIASSSAVMNYREQLKMDQEAMAGVISAMALGGRELDVVWNLTLAANIISANVQYGKIDAIAAIPGVKDVIVETRYEPAVVSKGDADPNMATSSEQIGSTTAYLEGYYGAGSRIAIIDTGTDTDHQSFDNGAFLYALQQGAAAAEMEYDAYVASLDLLDAEEIAAVLTQLHAYEIMEGELTADELYVNEKLAFGFNYIDASLNLVHDDDQAGEHGSHVAGIATANRYIPDGEGGYVEALDEVCVQGVAPDAQLITMKVFGEGGGAYDSDYMAAIEDAILLGCDAVNLSLGSGNPGMTENSKYADILAELAESDTVVVMSAGNSGGWADASTNGLPYLFYDDVSMHTGGSPGTYTNSLGVASVDNSGYTLLGFEVNGNKIGYVESDYSNAPFATLAGEQAYVMIDGIGTPEDWAAVGNALVGKIALCSRGETSFYEKANAAVEAGAIGVIIYNNQDGIINMDLTDYSYTAPVVSITQADGAIIKAASTDMGGYYTGTMTISEKVVAGQYGNDYYTMSSFSSWGVPGDLSMKPEITAPGGAIYSVFGSTPDNTATNKYELMSGTSMAAPQVTGMMALLMQYIRENDLSVDGLTDRALAQSLLMSTAEPVIEELSGYYYSVLKQGAGLANIGAAVQANSYILMGADATDSYADGKVKVELGDDPDKTGEYSFNFSVNNMTNKDQSYTLAADFFTQGIANAGSGIYVMHTATAPLSANVSYSVNGVPVVSDTDLLGMDFDGDNDVDLADGQALLDYATGKITALSNAAKADLDEDQDVDSHDAYMFFSRMSEGVVTVPANGSVTVTVDVMLDPNDFYLNFYPNGAYVEGYVYVCGMATEEGVLGETHSIPVLGFYGNWTDASMFDKGSYWDYETGAETLPGYLFGINNVKTNFISVKYAGDSTEYIFGGNPYVPDATYMPERNAISTETGDALNKLYYTAIRNAGASKFEIIDAGTGEVYLSTEPGAVTGAYYNVNGEQWRQTKLALNLGWKGTDAEGDKLNNNTVVDLVLTLAPELYANADGSYNWDALGKGASLTNRITIDNTAPELLGDEPVVIEDNTLTITVRDNQYVAAVALFDAYGQYTYTLVGADPEAEARKAITYELDISEVNGASFLLQVYDYAGNTTTYEITEQIGEVTDTIEGVTVTPASLTLQKNNTAALTVNVLPVNATNRDVTWSSSDESVATVDENGVVTAVGVGAATITVTSVKDPTKSAACAVEVIDIAVDLNGIVWDEEGSIWFSQFNTADLPNYTKLSGDMVEDDYFVAAAVGPDGTLYAGSLDTDTLAGAIYTIEVSEAAGETVYTPVKLADCNAGIDLFAADLAYAPGMGVLMGLYGPYALLINPVSGEIIGVFNWLPGKELVSIAYEGSMFNSNYNAYMDFFFLLDSDGNLYEEAFINLGGQYYYFFGPADGLMGNTGISTDLPYFQSMYVDGDHLFISNFVNENNYVALYALDLNTYNIYTLGKFADGVWPVAGLYNGADVAVRADASTYAARGLADMTIIGEMISAADCDLEPLFVGTSGQPAAGGLNSAVVVENKAEMQRSTSEVAPEEDSVELIVTAKDALGEDVDSTNGVVTVTYDAASLELGSILVHGDYQSIVVDETAGTVTIGYVSLAGIDAGDAVATITFTVKNTAEGQFAIDHKETGSEEPGYQETVEITYDHTYGDWYEYDPATCTEPGEERRDCQYCDAYESRVLNPLNHSYGEWYEYAPATCTESGEERRDCVRGDHYESREINPLNHNWGDWYEHAPATCTESGEERRICANDAEHYESRPIEATGHAMGDWYVTVEPTMESEGEARRDCANCDHYETKAIPALNGSGSVIPAPGPSVPAPGPSIPTPGPSVPAPGPIMPPAEPEVPALPFVDVKDGDRFFDSVKFVYDEGLMVGVSDDRFDTESTLTRAMLVTTLYRLENKPAVDFAGTFSDVADGKWYSEAVEWAAAKGIILGYTDGSFGVNDAVTNEQLAAILYRYADMKGYSLSAAGDLGQYTDGAKISDYAVNAMIWSLGNDLTATEGNVLAARQGATRGQVAYALHHLMVNVMGY